MGGSFFATTAERIIFDDGLEFSAIEPEDPTLVLNLQPGLSQPGLQFGKQSGKITVQGQGHTITGGIFFPIFFNNTIPGLQVSPGNTLGLMGREVNLSGGVVRVGGGHIHLSAIEDGLIQLRNNQQTWNFDVSQVNTFGDITLATRSLLDTSGFFTGDIQLNGNNIRLEDASTIVIQNLGPLSSGNIAIKATGLLQISDALRTAPDQIAPLGSITGVSASRLTTETLSSGRAGNIGITSNNLSIRDAALVTTRSYSDAPTGNIDVNVAQHLEIRDFSPLNPNFVTGITTAIFDQGHAGEVHVSAQSINLLNGGAIASNNFGTGDGGAVNVQVSEDLMLSGFITEVFAPASIGSPTFRTGRGGTVTIEVARLHLFNGGVIQTSNTGAGESGQIVINASESINIEGIISEGPQITLNSGIASDTPILDPAFRRVLSVPDIPSGNSGNLLVTTPYLSITNNGQIAVSNQGFGQSGSLKINANQIFLNNQAGITSFSVSGTGGNISLNVADTLLVQNQSQISSDARGSLEDTANPALNGNGGNIDIRANHFTLLNQSQINSSSFEGNGGNISLEIQENTIVANSQIQANVNQDGQGGDIAIATGGTLQLTNSAITATTASGDGGNLRLQVSDVLSLRNNSTISTTAGQASAGGNGGDIEIETLFILGIADENSDITANAFTGMGGNIQIVTNSILGLQSSPQLTPFSDITASSELGVRGTITIDEFTTDPGNLTELFTGLIHVDQQIVPTCNSNHSSRFAITGRGGMVISPEERLVHDRPWDDLRDIPLHASLNTELKHLEHALPITDANLDLRQTRMFTEATTWHRTPQGHLELVAPTQQHVPWMQSEDTCLANES